MLSDSNSFMMEDQQMPPSSSSSSASSSPAPSSPLSPHHTATFETNMLDEYGSSINHPSKPLNTTNTATTTLNNASNNNIEHMRSAGNDDSLPPIASIPPNNSTSRVVNVGPIMNAIQAYSGNNGNSTLVDNVNVRISSASSSCSTISDHSMNNTMINGQAPKPLNDFENVFASFKKRNREQYENNNQSSSSSDPVSYIRDLEDKIDFMAQLVTIQSAKMRKMEMRLKKLENLLPQSGDEFVNSGNLHRMPHSDELSSISDDIPTFSAPKKEKGNRQPNAYNIFMKGEIQRIRTTHTELTQKQAFKLAANNWTLKKSEILGASNGSQKKPDDRTSTVSTPSDTTMADSLSETPLNQLDEK
ncbi:predicted protein [Naegleria gruberi]|uniref:Predicted protein n=1 Tax=Naegleria gruberi TaxID=5762 RepID=D2VCG1_NAEGR|nr:uncharacterized protein NAEGRDRAFT_48419 [Naegleria gruberi]EFC45300.1 predicted protein [Naegleria gruberi]|eukprot:XP_002678044.1 predicted protein [Naegleria gruberi strain NEG-M]